MKTECFRRSLHSVALLFGRAPDPTKPELKDVVSSKGVLQLAQKEGIKEIGCGLSYAEDRALMAVQKWLDRTDYKGNARAVKSAQPDTYQFYGDLPVLHIKTAEYLEAYGVQRKKTRRSRVEFNSQSRKVAIEALESLAKRKFLMVYSKSKEEKSNRKVTVEVVAPLIKLEESENGRMLTITPNPVLVDHEDSYFMLTPENIFEMAGTKSHVQVRFLEFLLYQAEMKRRGILKDEGELYEVRNQPKVIAHWLRLNGRLDARQKGSLRKRLNELYDFGVKVQFLESYKRDQDGTKKRKVDVLKLNKAKFDEFAGKGLVPPVAKSTSKVRKV